MTSALSNMGKEIVLSVMLLFIGIAVLVVIHICLASRAFRDSSVPRIAAPIPRLSIEDLQRIPCFQFEQERTEEIIVECVVCLESFEEGDKFRVLPNCFHRFHCHCIDSWLLKTPICPICRTTIRPPLPLPSYRDGNRGVGLV